LTKGGEVLFKGEKDPKKGWEVSSIHGRGLIKCGEGKKALIRAKSKVGLG